jgi:hypothetical protein
MTVAPNAGFNHETNRKLEMQMQIVKIAGKPKLNLLAGDTVFPLPTIIMFYVLKSS